MRNSGLILRVLTALVTVPLVLVLIWAESLRPVFSLFIAGLAAMGLYEYFDIVQHRKVPAEMAAGIILGTLVALSGHTGQLTVTTLALCAAAGIVCFTHMFRKGQSAEGTATSVFGVLYVGWFFCHVSLLRAEPVTGAGLATLLLVTVALTDAGAYATGKLIGRHKLAPKLSPNKTWEGAIGGLTFSVTGATVMYVLSRDYAALPQWPYFQYALVGAVLSVVSQLGDLAESGMKRSANVKDSGFLFPGHGGVLDRCDGYLFAAPVLYYMVVAFRSL